MERIGGLLFSGNKKVPNCLPRCVVDLAPRLGIREKAGLLEIFFV